MNGFRVTMDTQDDSSIKLHHGTTTLIFPHSVNGLYYCTKDDMVSFSSKVQENSGISTPKEKTFEHVSFLQTHTNKDIDKALQVRELQQQMMWPSDQAMKTYLRHGMIKDTNLEPKDLDNAKEILGRAEAPLKGKTTIASMTKDKSQQIILQDIPGLEERMVKLYIDLFLRKWHTFSTHQVQKPQSYHHTKIR